MKVVNNCQQNLKKVESTWLGRRPEDGEKTTYDLEGDLAGRGERERGGGDNVCKRGIE